MNTSCFFPTFANLPPDQEILVSEDARLTCVDLQQRINRLASALRCVGLGRGSRIGILQMTSNHHVEAYYATSKLGGAFVPLNWRAKPEELEYLINAAQVDALLVGERFVDLAMSLCSVLPTVKNLVGLDRRHPGILYHEDLAGNQLANDSGEDVCEDETNVLVFTRGTSSLPKPVMLSYAVIGEYILESAELAEKSCRDVTLLSTPLHHVIGITTMIKAISAGQRLVLMRRFDAKEWLRLVEQERVTNVFLVPARLKKLIDDPDFAQRDLRSLETVAYGGAPTALSLIRLAIENFPRHVSFVNLFGQTETIFPIAMVPPEEHRLSGAPGEIERKLKRLSSVGRAVPNVDIRIVDPEGREVPRGEVGEISVRSPRLMKGYFGLDALTRELFQNGWMRTRDLGWMDEDGYVFVVGRKDDIIIQNESGISFSAIESLMVYPGISSHKALIAPRIAPGENRALGAEGKDAVSVDDFLQFLNSVSDTLDVQRLRENYLASIPNLVAASAYGFLLLEPVGESETLLSWEDFVRQSRGSDEEPWLVHEPLAVNLAWRWHSPHAVIPLSGGEQNGERRGAGSKEPTDAQTLTRFARVPLATVDGEVFGGLGFARTASQPPFDSNDVKTIRMVARQMCLLTRNALQHTKVRDRSALAEAVLDATGTAVIVTDGEGRVKFANARAHKLIKDAQLDPLLLNRIHNGLRDNLLEIETLGKRVATRDVRFPDRTEPGHSCLILRSARVSCAQGPVATFFYAQEEIPSFQHLASLLSHREIEVLELVARGFQNKEIADILAITVHTVKHHLNQMFRKMQANSRAELLAKAFSSSPQS